MSDLTIDEQRTIAANKIVFKNSVPVANIIELATSVVITIAGKDVADMINKESLSRGLLTNLVANRIKDRLLGDVKC